MKDNTRSRTEVRSMILSSSWSLLCLGLIYGWSVFRGPFSEAYPKWTSSNLSMVFCLSMIFFGIGSFAGGRMLTKFREWKVMLIGTAMVGVSLMGVSFLRPEYPRISLFAMYILYGGFGGGGIGICYNCINSVVPFLNPQKKGTISGILMASYGGGTMILGMLANELISIPGIGLFKTFRILAIVLVAALGISALLFWRINGEVCGYCRQDGEEESYGFSPGEVLRLKSFWNLIIRNTLCFAACLIVIDHCTQISAFLGLPAFLGLISSVFNGLSRIASGIACDRFESTRVLAVDNVVLVVAAVLLLSAAIGRNSFLGFLGIALSGASYGLTPPASVVINNEYFGNKYRTVNYAFFNLSLAPASFLGPYLASYLQEQFRGGYLFQFGIVMVYAVISLGLILRLRKPDQSGWK